MADRSTAGDANLASHSDVEPYTLKPGTKAPESGIYAVRHERHATTSYVTVVEDEPLPECRTCGQHVRFELVHAAPHIRKDQWLRHYEGKIVIDGGTAQLDEAA